MATISVKPPSKVEAPSATTGVSDRVTGPVRIELPITGITRSGGPALEQALRTVHGVRASKVNIEGKRASVEYEPAEVTVGQLAQAVRRAGYDTGGASLRLDVQGLYCAECAARIKGALRSTPGVLDASLNAATEEAKVDYLPTSVNLEALTRAVEAAGPYRAMPAAPASEAGQGRERSEQEKVPIQRVVDVVSGYFTPAVMILAVVGFVAWYVFGPPPSLAFALIVAMTTLIIACPCALGMATPMSLTTGVGLGAQNGILIRSGEALQTASRLQTIVLDKTGTITKGKPELTNVVADNGFEEEEILRLAAAVERSSEHPLAGAIVEGARARGLALPEIANFAAVPGHGVEADDGGPGGLR